MRLEEYRTYIAAQLNNKRFLQSLYWNLSADVKDRVMNILEEIDAPFTYFICAKAAERHPGMLKLISKCGNEIASHGYEHKADLSDFCKSLRVFADMGYRVKGYRAPNLEPFNNPVLLDYFSNTVSFNTSVHKRAERVKGPMDRWGKDIKNCKELPISAPCDWEMIVYRGKTDPKYLVRYWSRYLKLNAVFLFHPLRMGHPRYLPVLEKLVKKSKYSFITMSQMAKGEKGICLTGDIGLFQRRNIF